MNAEGVGFNPEEHAETMVDGEWYVRLWKILGSEDTEDAYIPDVEELEEQKSKFIAGELDAPNPILKNLDFEKLAHRQKELSELKADILKESLIKDEGQNESLRWLYRWRINEEIARVRMYEVSKRIQELRQDPGANPTELRRNEIAFDRYNKFIYGEPSAEVFSDTLLTIRATAETELDSENEELRLAARGLLDVLPKPPSAEKIGTPSEVTFEAVKAAVNDDIEGYEIDLENFPEKSDAEAIVNSFNENLQKIGATWWKAVIDQTGRRLITLRPQKGDALIPETRKAGPKKMVELTIHEILSHILRGVHGLETGLGLAMIGFDRYERADEGIATARSQSQKESFEGFASMVDHLAISLARGLDADGSGRPNYRNFRGVYDILYQYNYYKQIKIGKTPDLAKENAANDSWNTARMCFRGTGYDTPGFCNREKIMYREGNIETWGQLDDDPQTLIKFVMSLGKVDTNNQRHIYALHQLKIITQEELEQIEKAIFDLAA